MKRIAIGQAGGPTAVINTSLAGFIENLPGDTELYTVENGYEGLAESKIQKADRKRIEKILDAKYDSGACLGSGRYEFTEDKIVRAVKNLKAYGMDSLAFIGGNGTMAALEKKEEIARAEGMDLQVLGIPKTVDNDLGMTDHAPGFGSAAKHVAYSVRDISRDLESMRNFEKVRILETMGRNAGWLAAAAGALMEEEKCIICLPEQKISLKSMADEVRERLKSQETLVVVVSEGVEWDGANPISQAIIGGRVVLGGAATYLQEALSAKLGMFVRSENLGISQRALSLSVSETDRQEAYLVGAKAAKLLEENVSRKMVCIERESNIRYNVHIGSCDLQKVKDAGERTMPLEFIRDRRKFYEWLKPLI